MTTNKNIVGIVINGFKILTKVLKHIPMLIVTYKYWISKHKTSNVLVFSILAPNVQNNPTFVKIIAYPNKITTSTKFSKNLQCPCVLNLCT